jgi:hypothetical protein
LATPNLFHAFPKPFARSQLVLRLGSMIWNYCAWRQEWGEANTVKVSPALRERALMLKAQVAAGIFLPTGKPNSKHPGNVNN